MQTFLESFKTPQEIAAECRKRGIKGVQHKCGECIIAELLKSEFPERFENGNEVLVLPDDGRSDEGEVLISRRGAGFVAEYILPLVANDFAMAFDEGDYPDLIKESPNG